MSMERNEREHLNHLIARVAHLEKQLAALYKHLNLTPPAEHPPLDEVEQLLRIGDRMAAIQRYREHSGCDLATAKTAVDQLAAQLGIV